jgi:Flp pilus assembly protein TadB
MRYTFSDIRPELLKIVLMTTLIVAGLAFWFWNESYSIIAVAIIAAVLTGRKILHNTQERRSVRLKHNGVILFKK